MSRGFSIDAIVLSQKIKGILEAESDWMQYEALELKAGRHRYISDYSFPFVMVDALNYLNLCGAVERKDENDLVFYRKITSSNKCLGFNEG